MALALPNLKCINGGFPTTSFLLTQQQQQNELLVINHNGAKYAPVYSGIVTPSDVDFIKRSEAFFAKIGDRFAIPYKTENCRLDEKKYLTCSLKQVVEISGLKIESAYFTTSESVDKIPDFEFVRTNVRLSLREVGSSEDYKLEMSYYGEDCQLQ